MPSLYGGSSYVASDGVFGSFHFVSAGQRLVFASYLYELLLIPTLHDVGLCDSLTI